MLDRVSQFLKSPINMPVWQGLGIVVLSHLMYRSPLHQHLEHSATYLIRKIEHCARSVGHGAFWAYEQSIPAFHSVFENCISISIAPCLAFVVHHVATQFYPVLSLSSQAGKEGSFKVAAFVGAAFFLKAALTPYSNKLLLRRTLGETNLDTLRSLIQVMLQEVQQAPEANQPAPAVEPTYQEKLRATTIHYLCPLALTSIAARYYGFPVKIAQSALLTLSLFAGIKLLGKGFEYVIERERVKSFLNGFYKADEN